MASLFEVIEPISGDKKKWIRARNVSIFNPLDGIIQVEMILEQVTQYPDGKYISSPAGVVKKSITDPNELLVLVNPETGVKILDSTYGAIAQQVYVEFYSILLDLIAKRG